MHRWLVALFALGASCVAPELPSQPAAEAPVTEAPRVPLPVARPEPPVVAAGVRDRIGEIVAGSQCAAHVWGRQGRAPEGYLQGMALVFARAACHPDRPDVAVIAAAPGADADARVRDGLAWYGPQLRDLGMASAGAGIEALRRTYTLMIGLGIRESTGMHCVAGGNSGPVGAADTARAGLFQTTWRSSRSHPTLPDMFRHYQADRSACLLDVFGAGVSCRDRDARISGDGTGAQWQALAKSCPAFATEYAAVVLRTNGGSRGEYGPIRTRSATIRPECDAMLRQVQELVESNPAICSAL